LAVHNPASTTMHKSIRSNINLRFVAAAKRSIIFNFTNAVVILSWKDRVLTHLSA
jgi:hypothetical protein